MRPEFSDILLNHYFNNLNTDTTQEEYVREGIEWEHVDFFDNSSICDLVERTDCGLISLLDEAAMRKQPLAGFFMSQSTDGEQSPAALAAGYFLGAAQEKKKHWNTEPKICDTILDHVGNTPLVRLNKIPQAEGVE